MIQVKAYEASVRFNIPGDGDVVRDMNFSLTFEEAHELLRAMQTEIGDQAWFWTPEWQAGEREADADIAAGRATTHETAEDFIAALEQLPPDALPSEETK